MMKPDRLSALLLALVVLVICCLTSCEEECPPCVPQPTPNPGARLIGLWIVFEAFINGIPNQTPVGMEWEFRDNDTLIVEGGTGLWVATEDKISISDLTGGGSVLLDYYFEADTLDMTGEIMSDTVRFRLLREEDYPGP